MNYTDFEDEQCCCRDAESQAAIHALLHAVDRMSDVELARVLKDLIPLHVEGVVPSEGWSRQKTVDFIKCKIESL